MSLSITYNGAGVVPKKTMFCQMTNLNGKMNCALLSQVVSHYSSNIVYSFVVKRCSSYEWFSSFPEKSLSVDLNATIS